MSTHRRIDMLDIICVNNNGGSEIHGAGPLSRISKKKKEIRDLKKGGIEQQMIL